MLDHNVRVCIVYHKMHGIRMHDFNVEVLQTTDVYLTRNVRND